MRDILDQIRRWQAAGDTFALATVVDTSSSAPRGPGAAVAVHPDGTVLGSVSGGCVEGAVVETCREVLAGDDAHLVTYGYSDDEAFAVGLTCGGTIHVFVQAITPDHPIDVTAVGDEQTEDGVRNAAEIAAVPEVDALWIGHFDLSCSLGIPGEFDHPTFAQAVADVVGAAKQHGKALGRLTASVEEGATLAAQGFDLICYSGDVWLLQAALADAVAALRRAAT